MNDSSLKVFRLAAFFCPLATQPPQPPPKKQGYPWLPKQDLGTPNITSTPGERVDDPGKLRHLLDVGVAGHLAGQARQVGQVAVEVGGGVLKNRWKSDSKVNFSVLVLRALSGDKIINNRTISTGLNQFLHIG